MSDDLDDLKAAMDAATPAPDAATKAAHLALAQENFARLQGSAHATRPISNRPFSGLWTGMKTMLDRMTSRGALTATTALVAIGFVLLTPLGDDLLSPPAPGLVPVSQAPAGVNDRSLAQRQRAEADSIAPAAAPKALSREQKDSDGVAALTQAPQAELHAFSEEQGMVLLEQPVIPEVQPDTETFANAAPNPLQITAENPVSTFSIDVDTASYAVVRNALMNGALPDPDAVRVEEMVNYFPYDYAAPTGDAPFRPTVSVARTPWNPNTQLVHIGIQGVLPDVADRPPLNLVFLIDTSGSMNQPNKLPLLKQSFRLMLGQLRAQDQVAIVTYAGSAGQVLAPTDASDTGTILTALDRLEAGGSTAGQAGLQQAYLVADAMAQDGEVTRVVLATDGDFNVGLSDPEALKTYIAQQRDSGTYLSVLGFGRGNLDDATMQALAQNGNGQAAYIDTLGEAQKVLVDQLTGALFPIANDVKIQVEFNPAEIAEYRLIGYETRALRREDFNNDAVDAGDIGAGHSVTALYEVTPVGSPAQLSEPLRFGTSAPASDSGELGFLRIRYKLPGADDSQLIETPITTDRPAIPDTGFAMAIAGFGQLLRGSDYLQGWTYGDAIALANANKGADEFGYRSEAVRLMRLAQSLSGE